MKKFLIFAVNLLLMLSFNFKSNAEDLGKKWNPLYLDVMLSKNISEKYLENFNISRASIGYIYAIPPYYHLKQRYAFLSNFSKFMGEKAGNPFGQFLLLREPVNPQMPDVMPNLDTLYGITFLELKDTAFVLKVPKIENRYYSFAFVDAYFYNFDYVGSRTDGQKAGNYLIVGPNWNGKIPNDISKIIKSPTNSINIYERIYFNNLDDAKIVNKIQDEIKLIPLQSFINPSINVKMPNIKDYLREIPETNNPINMIKMTNKYMGENYPPLEDKSLIEYFASTGIGPNIKISNNQQNTNTIINGIRKAENYLSGLALNNGKVVNGWQIPPIIVGKRGGFDSIAIQAMMQLRSVGLNATAEAVYYTTYVDSKGQPLKGGNNYTLTFSKNNFPPVLKNKFGFWSITLYNRETLKLIENTENKYAVKSVSKFKYGKNDSLTIYISPIAPKNLKENWLPSPQDGEFILVMRAYIGNEKILNGNYAPPAVIKQNK